MGKRISLLTFCAVLALMAATRRLAAQAGVIRGRVTDSTGAALGRVSVTIEALGARATTDDQGNYELRSVPAGSHTVRVRLLGYVPLLVRVSVAEGQPTRQDFALRTQPIALSPIDVVVGSRARHTASEELAVPVDVYGAEQLTQQGTTETSEILQSLAPSVNFPRQSVTDANDIVRPFTLRGLSPDQTLVLVNGWRRHQTALVNNFAYGMPAGSSGVDMNAIPQSAIDRIEVLRDGAAAQYGSDAIAGVVNVVTKEGRFTPFVNVASGRYASDNYPGDGTTVDVNGGWGIGLGRGSLGLFGEFLDREPTNRAFADPNEDSGNGLTDVVNSEGQVAIKRNPVPQPNFHWGDGLEKDVLTMANFRMPLSEARTSEIYAFGGYSFRRGTGNGYRRYESSGRNWPQIYPLGFLPEFHPDVRDYSMTGGFRGATHGWSVDIGASFGHNDFKYNLRNTLNASLGPCLDPAAPCAPGPDHILGNADDPGIPNKTSFFAGQLVREEIVTAVNATKTLELGLPAPVNLAVGAAFRRERYQIIQGERASWINGGHAGQDSVPGNDGIFGTPDDTLDIIPGSQVFSGFAPSDESNSTRTNFGAYAELETNLTKQFLASVAGRFEHYSDFGSLVTGKAAFRYQPSPRLTLRAAGSTGFRAPGLSQIHFSKVVANVISGQFEEIGIFPVDHPASKALGSKPLKEETSVNLSGGLAFSPRDNVTLTADYFYIKIDDRILLGATFNDAVGGSRTLLDNAGFTCPGSTCVTGVQYFTNGLDTRTQGVDVTASVRVPVRPSGTLQLTGALNYTKNEITRVDPLPAVLQNAGSTLPGIIDTVTTIATQEERPDWRATVTAEYSTGRLHGLARGSYFGKFSSSQPGLCDLCRERYGAKALFDTEIGYRFDQVDLSVGVRNLFDTYPDRPSSLAFDAACGTTSKDCNTNGGVFPWAAASPFGYNGRYLYTRASITLSR